MALVFGLSGCAFFAPKKETESAGPKPAEVRKVLWAPPIALVLHAEKGRVEVSENCSVSVTKTFLDGDLRHKKIELVDFKVKTTTAENLANGNFLQVVETLAKDGSADLHDMAFPELGEKIDFELTPQTNVKRAGKYPRGSIFYVQPLPLPQGPVKIGDQWTNSESWMGASGIPLTAFMRTKFVSVKPCGKSDCAELTIEGEVHMPKKLEEKNGFKHSLKGRFLFEPISGLVVWSEFSSLESLEGKEARAVVESVLRSSLIEPRGYYTKDREGPSCPIETKE